jgi:hypothetical protein
MPYCQYCGGKINKNAVVCPKCGENLVGDDDAGWQELQIQEKIDEAKHRANMYIISAIVLATMGIVAGWVLCASSSAVGLFGIALVCLGVGCSASADRHEHKAKVWKRRLGR